MFQMDVHCYYPKHFPSKDQFQFKIDSINTTQPFGDGDSIVSASGSFKLGFFSLGSSSNRYLGISYNQISTTTMVWVANRGTPLNDSSGVLRLTSQGILILFDHSGSTIWSSNSSRSARTPIAQLLDSGNLVVKEEGDGQQENSLWQSFDYPSDTFLPNMKLGRNKVTSLDRYISSWESADDPSIGSYTFRLDPAAYSELIVREDSDERFRSGPWNGMRFSGAPQLIPNPIYTYRFVYDDDEEYYTYELVSSSFLSRMVINQNGHVQRFDWNDRTQSWELYLSVQTDDCDRYALCGADATCSINNSPVCGCLQGFAPSVAEEWDKMNWSSGCVRKTPLTCSGDGFGKFSGIKFPETRKSWFNRSMSLDECRNTCLKNCSCTAYANLEISIIGGSGCLLWFGDLIDMKQINGNGQDIYIRMATSELGNNLNARPENVRSKNVRPKIIVIGIASGLTGILIICIILYSRRKASSIPPQIFLKKKHNQDLEDFIRNHGPLALKRYKFSDVKKMTNFFNDELGQGGYGTVYKGRLTEGHLVAVKVLKDSQGNGEEFINEVASISRTSHVNVVTLLGFCLECDKRVLIFDFMPNGSLDKFINHENTLQPSQPLGWEKVYQIVVGVARGLEYLHQGCNTRIVHFDIKPHNILLDADFCPKISDFGLAKPCTKKESNVSLLEARGTIGYIAPEVCSRNFGPVSHKSDVYSYGMMVLEMVGGRKNNEAEISSSSEKYFPYLIYKQLEVDGAIEAHGVSTSEQADNVRKIRIVGLQCIQTNPADRPSMSKVIEMLEGPTGALKIPPKPLLSSTPRLLSYSTSLT